MSDKNSSSALLAFSTALADLIRASAPSLVSVQSERAQSTGFSWRPGLIVAAENALSDDGEVSIVAHDRTSNPAQIVGRDPSSDVALLRVARTDLPKAPAQAEALAVGALAVVAAAREGAPSAALGVVSFVGPQWRSLRGGVIDARIELDAALTRSSEGGLVLDAEGRALGMAVFGPRRRTLVIPLATIDRVAELLAITARRACGRTGGPVTNGMNKSATVATVSLQRSFTKRSGSTSDSPSACATSKICWRSAEWRCPTRPFGVG